MPRHQEYRKEEVMVNTLFLECHLFLNNKAVLKNTFGCPFQQNSMMLPFKTKQVVLNPN